MPEAVGDTLCVPIFFEIAFIMVRAPLEQGARVGEKKSSDFSEDGPLGRIRKFAY